MAQAQAPTEVSAAALAALLGITQRAVQDAASRKVIVKGSARGSYQLAASVRNYCTHLRRLAQGMGGEEALEDAARQRAKLAKAQAALAEAKAAKLSGEVVEVAAVEKEWTGRLRALRSRIMAIGDKLRHLPARDHVRLMAELRAALTEAAEGEG
jgi:phage terminase Nu1 subunit (DNA packaging protein)